MKPWTSVMSSYEGGGGVMIQKCGKGPDYKGSSLLDCELCNGKVFTKAWTEQSHFSRRRCLQCLFEGDYSDDN